MSWYHAPWTQDDAVLGGLPYTAEPPAPYSIDGVKTIWHWSPRILDGLPFTVAPPERWGFKAIYVGSTRVRAVYRGETLVWAVGIPREITLGTWDDLAALTWDDASAYTWNEIGGN